MKRRMFQHYAVSTEWNVESVVMNIYSILSALLPVKPFDLVND